MILNKKIYLLLIEIYILVSQVQGRCVAFSQRNDTEFCDVTESFLKAARNVTGNYYNDIKTTTLSQLLPKIVTNSSANDLETCSSELNLENKLINIAIENLLDLRGLNLIKLSQDRGNLSHSKRDGNITDKIIRKRSTLELQTMLPHKQNSKKHKKLRHHHNQSRYFK